jgi:hypothetical protein
MSEAANRKPAQTLDFDLVIVGGGLAGLCAAIAAARNGTRTALIQDRPVFGGNSSSEIRIVPLGTGTGAAWNAETGIVHELLLKDRAVNHQTFFDHGMANSIWDMTLAEAARREPLLTTFMNTTVRGVTAVDIEDPSGYSRRIASVSASQLQTEKEFVFTGRHFMDATGDGTVGYLAGAQWRYGREARAEFGEHLAPTVASDQAVLGATIPMRAKDFGRPVPYTPPDWIAPYTKPEDFVMDRKLFHAGEKDDFGGYWWLEVNDPFHQIDDVEPALHQEILRHVIGVWNYLKNHAPFKDKFENFVLEWVGQLVGKRESRRLMGDVILTEQHCVTDQRWPDAVAFASWWIDLHSPMGINNKQAPAAWESADVNFENYVRVSPFSIPLRCYYSKNVENLWMVGRDISVTHVGLGGVRVMLTCGAQGQAIGTAASYALQHGLTPRQTADPDGEHVRVIRQRLVKQDAHLLSTPNEDPLDHALRARASASSSSALAFPDPASLHGDEVKWRDLDAPKAQVVPITTEGIAGLDVYLRNPNPEPVTVPVAFERLDTIWDRVPTPAVATGAVEVPGGFQGWVSATLEGTDALEPDHSYRIALGPAAGAAWASLPSLQASTRSGPLGTVANYFVSSPGGPEPRHKDLPVFSYDEIDLPAYEYWRQYRKDSQALRLSPEQRPYEPRFAVNGWAWPEQLPNAWLSEPVLPGRPQYLQLEWDEPVDVVTVHVSFDTNLDLDTQERPEFFRGAQCAKDWALQVRRGGTWHEVYRETDNYLRKRIVALPASARTDALRVVVESVNDPGSRVAVFEVRVYS